MDKIQAYHAFWSSFGLKAYNETSVPDSITDEHGNEIKLKPPYITYELATDFFGNELALTASIWYRSTNWIEVDEKEAEIAEHIGRGGLMVLYDGGGFWIKRGSPWAQRMSEASDDMIRRKVLNISIEFID